MNATYSPAYCPNHVENINSPSKLKALGAVGGDKSLNISLGEYGLAWIARPDSILFIYSAPQFPKRFECVEFPKDTDPKKEWDWVDWKALFSALDSSREEFFSQPLERIVSDLVAFYGPEEIFGSSYWEGFEIEGVEFE